MKRRLFICATISAVAGTVARTAAVAMAHPLPGDTWTRCFDGEVAVVTSVGNGNVEWTALGETCCHSLNEFQLRASNADTRYTGRPA